MFDDGWDEFDDWVDELLERVEAAPGGIRLGDAAEALRATSLGRELDAYDDEDLALLIDDKVGFVDRFGVVGPRDDDEALVDPVHAILTTTAAIMSGRKFSHRIDAAEVADRVVPLDGLLGILDFDIAGADQLSDRRGQPLDRLGSDRHALTVPDWVEGFGAGRLVIAWRDGDQVHFEVIDDAHVATDGAMERQVLLREIDKTGSHGIGANVTQIMFDQICQDRSLFVGTTPPVEELLRADGFTNRGEWWGPADGDWQTPGAAARASRLSLAADTYGLQRGAQDALARLQDMWSEWSLFHTLGHGERPELDLREVQDIMAIEMVPLAFFDMHEPEAWLPLRLALGAPATEQNGDDQNGDDQDRGLRDADDRANRNTRETALDVLADELSRAAPDSIAALLFTARSLELHGQALRSAAAYSEVLRRHPTNATALVKCMNAAVDASRFDEAIRLMRRLFGPGSTNESELQSYADAMISAGRNEPCPCGSGRKYKQCHQGVPLLSEPVATRALVFKVEMFAEQAILAERFAPGSSTRARAELGDHPEVRDFMIHEGGMLVRFLERRVDLLSASELERLRSWQAGRRDLYEVMEIDRGVGMSLRNVRTGDDHQIVERTGSYGAQLGQYLLLRLETVDGVTTSYGQGAIVPARDRDRMLDIMDDPEIDDLVAWFADLLAPPQLATRDGEDLVFARALISSTATVKQMAKLLDGAFGVDGLGEGPIENRTWSSASPNKGEESGWVRASMGISDGHVELSTMSVERHGRYLAELLELLPGAEVVEESFDDPADALAGRRDLDVDFDDDDFADDWLDETETSEELQEILDKHIRAMEANWLHENIPALDGLTPTQASDDPTRRPDLIRLLNSFSAGPNGFDPDRLRAALGLDPGPG